MPFIGAANARCVLVGCSLVGFVARPPRCVARMLLSRLCGSGRGVCLPSLPVPLSSRSAPRWGRAVSALVAGLFFACRLAVLRPPRGANRSRPLCGALRSGSSEGFSVLGPILPSGGRQSRLSRLRARVPAVLARGGL